MERSVVVSLRQSLFNEKRIHFIFDLSLWLKGAFALCEIAAGIATFFVTKQFLVNLVLWVFRDEFVEDPRDLVATFLLQSTQGLSITSQNFAALYLLAHGVVKLWLIIGLMRKRLWYYPTALIVFGLFVFYQLYRYTFAHSAWLLALTALDLLVIALTWHEWRYLTHMRAVARGESGAVQ